MVVEFFEVVVGGFRSFHVLVTTSSESSAEVFCIFASSFTNTSEFQKFTFRVYIL